MKIKFLCGKNGAVNNTHTHAYEMYIPFPKFNLFLSLSRCLIFMCAHTLDFLWLISIVIQGDNHKKMTNTEEIKSLKGAHNYELRLNGLIGIGL